MRPAKCLLVVLAAGCGGDPGSAPQTSAPLPAQPAPAPEPAPVPVPEGCTDERNLAVNYLENILPDEWDGTPFRVDFIDNFPDAAGEGYLEGQLLEVAWLANLIEEQLGYPILEAGGIVAVPLRGPLPGCQRWREPRQIIGHHLAVLPGGQSGGGALSATPRCASVQYWVGSGPLSGDLFGRTAIVHEIFHLFGYKHANDTRNPGSGIYMSDDLTSGRDGDAAQYPTEDDIAPLRCVFPEIQSIARGNGAGRTAARTTRIDPESILAGVGATGHEDRRFRHRIPRPAQPHPPSRRREARLP